MNNDQYHTKCDELSRLSAKIDALQSACTSIFMAASEEIDREFKSLIARKVDEEREEEQRQKDAKKKK